MRVPLIFLCVGTALISGFLYSHEVEKAHIPTTAIAYMSILDDIKSATKIVSDIYNVKNNSEYKALFLHIDSNGGSLAAAEMIAQAINECKKIKPVIAYIEGRAGSASYLVASATDWIIAQQLSEIGSLGVVSTIKLNKQEKVVNIVSGVYKRVYVDSDNGFEQQVLEYTQQHIDEMAQIVFKLIADGRGLSVEQIEAQQARFYHGLKALEQGLIDQICSMEDALKKTLELIIARGGTVAENIVLIDAKDGKVLMQL